MSNKNFKKDRFFLDSNDYFVPAKKELFNSGNVYLFIDELVNNVKAPHIHAKTADGGVRLEISGTRKNEWKLGSINSHPHIVLQISNTGDITKISGDYSNFTRGSVTSKAELFKLLNEMVSYKLKYDEGGNIQTPYYGASEVCNSLNTLVPSTQAAEQRAFNNKLKMFLLEKYGMSVEEYVAKKLRYNSVDELCYDPDPALFDSLGRPSPRFAQEQIDAIATAIYNAEENGDGIIIADQTGTGKGRVAAGLIRYAILNRGVMPFFFTEKKHLINDIYRDLYDIGFDAGVVIERKNRDFIKKENWTDSEIIKIIIGDLKNDEDFRYDLSVNYSDDFVAYAESQDKTPEEVLSNYNKLSEDDPFYEEIESIIEEAIDVYRQNFITVGLEKVSYTKRTKAEIELDYEEAYKKGRMKLRPFFPVSMDITDRKGNIIYRGLRSEEKKRLIGYKLNESAKGKEDKWVYDYESPLEDIQLPDSEEFVLFAVPYSMANKVYDKVAGNLKESAWLRFYKKFSKNSVLILDESHAAAGKSSNLGKALTILIDRSAMTTYLSATYSKKGENMPFYALKTSLRESGLDKNMMIAAFNNGGYAIQEAVSSELVKNGQFVRREKLIQGKSNYVYAKNEPEDEIGTEQAIKLNLVASKFAKVKEFSDKVRNVVAKFKKELPTRADNFGILVGSKDEIGNARSIKALTFQMFNFFLLGLKVEQTVQVALDKMANGRKPIITIANTLESALKKMPKTYLTAKDTDKYQEGDEIANDFKLYIAYLLFYSMKWKKTVEVVDEFGNKSEESYDVMVFDNDHPMSNEIMTELFGEYNQILSDILDTNFSTGVGIAPIDEILAKIEFASKGEYKMNEITGRQLRVKFENEDYSKGIIVKRDIIPTTELVRLYNENDIDGLFINQSGAVGISMQALPSGRAQIVYPTEMRKEVVDNVEQEVEVGFPTSLENREEVKKRCMIITQMELDVNKEVQKLGRINRTGQVYLPEYHYIISCIPSEARLTALYQTKLKSLSANVSSNQEQSKDIFTADDFFSIDAIEPFNTTMGILRDSAIAKKPEDIKDYTKMTYFKSFDEQKEFYDTFAEQLNSYISNLVSLGLYTGAVKIKDYKAEKSEVYPFLIGDNNAKTSFGKHAFLEKNKIVEYKKKTLEANIKLEIKNGTFYGYPIKGLEDLENGLNVSKNFYPTNQQEFKSIFKTQKDKYIKQKEESANKAISDFKTYIEKLKNDTATVEAKIIETAKKITEYEKLVEKVEPLKTKLDEIKKALAEAIDSDDDDAADKIPLLKKQQKETNEKLKPLSEKLESYGPVEDLLKEQKISENYLRKAKYEIEDTLDSISREEKYLNEEKEVVEDISKVVNMLESVVMYEEYKHETEEVWDEVKSEYVTEHTYTLESQEPAVVMAIAGIDFSTHITRSSISVHLKGLTLSYRAPVSKIYPAKKEGVEPTSRLEVMNPTWENYWNQEIAAKFDTSYKKDAYFITGSALRTYPMSKVTGFTGTLTKFSYKDGKDNLGVEIVDKAFKDDSGKFVGSQYNTIVKMYGENKKYPVFYEGIYDNLQNFFFTYIYKRVITDMYDDNFVINNSKIYEAYDLSMNSHQIHFVSQIATIGKMLSIGVSVKSSLLRELNNIRYSSNPQFDAMSYDDFIENYLDIKIIVGDKNVLFGFMGAIQEAGIERTDYSILSNITGASPNGSLGKEKDNFLIRKGYFTEFFPCDNNVFYTTTSSSSKQEQPYAYVGLITLSYAQFMGLIAYFNETGYKPILTTSNTQFDAVKDSYVFDSETKAIEVLGGTDEDLSFDPSIDSEVDQVITKQIENILKLITEHNV